MRTLTSFSLSLFLTFLSFLSFGQSTDLYNFITVNPNVLNTEQLARWNRIQTNDEYISFQFIEMTDFVRDNNYDGSLTTPITDDSILKFEFKYVTDRPDQLVWYGEYAYKKDSVYFWGNLLYIDDESGKFGTFSTESAAFEIIDLSGDVQVLAFLDTTEDHSICKLGNSIGSEPLDLPKIHSRQGSPCQIQVFATYTQAAADKVASIEQKAKLDIEIANAILKNSAIYQLEADFIYLGNSELTNFVFDAIDIDDDEADLEGSDELDSIRDEYYADIIIVYVPSDWEFPQGVIHGMAGDWDVALANNPPDL